MAEAVRITTRKNGPFRVEAPVGSIEILDADGNAFDLSSKVREDKLVFALCRCGGSTTKPFCDGTHSRTGFQAAEAAVRAEEAQKAKPVENEPPASSPAKG